MFENIILLEQTKIDNFSIMIQNINKQTEITFNHDSKILTNKDR